MSLPSSETKSSATWRWTPKYSDGLVLAAFILYALLIFPRLASFPFYFFCDEAIHGVESWNILHHSGDRNGHIMPLIFEGFGNYTLSLSIYFQVPFTYLFGLNEFSVRMRSAAFSLLGVTAAYAILKDFNHCARPWILIALLACSPFWFVHARTGYEGLAATSFYFLFVLTYLRSFDRRAHYALIPATYIALTFYMYTAARGWVALSLIGFFLVNSKPHWKNWRSTLMLVASTTIFLIPYFYFQFKYPQFASKRLSDLGVQSVSSFTDLHTLQRILLEYLRGLNPLYWFTTSKSDVSGPIERHIIPHLSLLPFWLLPFFLCGLAVLLKNFRTRVGRTLIVAALVIPLPAAMVGMHVLRSLPEGMLYLLISVLGFDFVTKSLTSSAVSLGIMTALSAYGLWFQTFVFSKAPTLYEDYAFYGIQMGAPQVFDWIKENRSNYTRFFVSNRIFNSGEIFPSFFLDSGLEKRVRVEDDKLACKRKGLLPDSTIDGTAWIVPAVWLEEVKSSSCPLDVTLRAELFDPNGKPLFVIVKISRQDTFNDWFTESDRMSRELISEQVTVGGTHYEVQHTAFDVGSARDLFDGDTDTLARTAGINPFRARIHFEPLAMHQIVIVLSHNHKVLVNVSSSLGGSETAWGSLDAETDGNLKTIQFTAPGNAQTADSFEISVTAQDADQNGYVHINEISWN